MVFTRTRMMVRRRVPLLRQVLRRDSKAKSAGPSDQSDDATDDVNVTSSAQSEALADAANEPRIPTCCVEITSVDPVATPTQDEMIQYIFDELDTEAVEIEASEPLDEIMAEAANLQTTDETYQPTILSEISLDSPGDIDAFLSPRLIYPVLIVGALTALGLVISGVYLFTSIESRMHAPVIRLYNDHIHLGIRGLVGGNAKIDYISTGFFCLVFYGTLLWFAIMTHREVMGRRAGDTVTVTVESATLGSS
ncbi:hypothetical protein V1525DRAFT_431193 [Lipomyces kononenkoae]|uniref:Uncharacterized protein n=1 Tax=Lipomyces kononenkoae TaxID=34357 RepID=A0ACC3T6M9_LIPKO